MLKNVSDSTIALLKGGVLVKLGISVPLSSEDVERLFEYVDEQEVALANAKAEGVAVNADYFKAICIAVDELAENESDSVDIEDLNSRLV